MYCESKIKYLHPGIVKMSHRIEIIKKFRNLISLLFSHKTNTNLSSSPITLWGKRICPTYNLSDE